MLLFGDFLVLGDVTKVLLPRVGRPTIGVVLDGQPNAYVDQDCPGEDRYQMS